MQSCLRVLFHKLKIKEAAMKHSVLCVLQWEQSGDLADLQAPVIHGDPYALQTLNLMTLWGTHFAMRKLRHRVKVTCPRPSSESTTDRKRIQKSSSLVLCSNHWTSLPLTCPHEKKNVMITLKHYVQFNMTSASHLMAALWSSSILQKLIMWLCGLRKLQITA